MKLAPKIAAVVALVIAASLVVSRIPRWKKKVREVHQENILAHLTPDQAIALCGKPIVDETETVAGSPARRIIVRNYYGLAVELDFTTTTNQPNQWKFTVMQDPSGEIKYDTPTSEIGVLPCLDKKHEQELQGN